MSPAKLEFRARLAWAIFMLIVVMTVCDFVFMRYGLYHSQNRSLKPDDYNTLAVTAEDYRSLSDPATTTAHLSDGSVLTKAAAWDSSNFKPIADGKMFIMVTTKGTAHILNQALPPLILFLVLGLVGLIATWPRKHRTDQASRT